MSSSLPLRAPHRVFSMDEILRMIFGGLAKQHNTVNARVCKAWSNEALNVIWNRVQATRIFGLLAPFERNSNGLLCFSRHIMHEDWVRFDRYSRRVRVLLINVCDHHIDPSVWQELSYGRPRMEILPHLQAVYGSFSSLVTTLFFCHPSVTTLQVILTQNDITPENFNRALSYLPTKTPLLNTFLVACLPDAKVLSPTTQTLMESTLARLTNLNVLRISGHWLTLGALDVLSSLGLSDIYIFSFPGAPLSPTPVDFNLRCKELVGRLCVTQPSLNSLCFETSDHQSQFTFVDAIEPILSLSRLSYVELNGVYPSDLDIPHFVLIFKSLPALTSFSMQYKSDNDTIGPPPPPLHISALTAIIPFCNNLEHLLIELDASSNVPPESPCRPCFPKLNWLQLGSSPILEPVSVARFLSGLLPDHCVLAPPGSRNDGAEETDATRALLKKMVAEFILVRRSERQRLSKGADDETSLR